MKTWTEEEVAGVVLPLAKVEKIIAEYKTYYEQREYDVFVVESETIDLRRNCVVLVEAPINSVVIELDRTSDEWERASQLQNLHWWNHYTDWDIWFETGWMDCPTFLHCIRHELCLLAKHNSVDADFLWNNTEAANSPLFAPFGADLVDLLLTKLGMDTDLDREGPTIRNDDIAEVFVVTLPESEMQRLKDLPKDADLDEEVKRSISKHYTNAEFIDLDQVAFDIAARLKSS